MRGSRVGVPDRINTQGLKITEEHVLPFLNYILKWLDVQVFSDKDYKPVGPVSCIFSVTWLAGDVKEPAHLSKRVRDVVPGEVVYLSMYESSGWAR